MNDFDYIQYVEILCKIIYTKSNDIKIIDHKDLINFNYNIVESLFNDLIGYDYATWGLDHSSTTNFQYKEIEKFAQTLIVEYIDTNEPGLTLNFLTTLKNTPVENIDWNDQELQRAIRCINSFGLINVDVANKYKITEFGKLILGNLE